MRKSACKFRIGVIQGVPLSPGVVDLVLMFFVLMYLKTKKREGIHKIIQIVAFSNIEMGG